MQGQNYGLISENGNPKTAENVEEMDGQFKCLSA